MEGRKLHIDLETRSAAPFGKNAGKEGVSAYQYANHPTTEVLWASYAFDDEPVKQWRAYRGDPFPDELAEAVIAGCVVGAHNAGFEWLMWNHHLRPLFELPELPIEQMDCTAARAAIMALPRDLDGVTKAMGMEHQKDDVGHKLMLKMSKPRRPRKNEDPNQIYWHESEADMERLGLYCDRDVEAERGLDRVLKPMTRFQRAQWLRVHRANMRGVQVDIEFVRKARLVDQVVSDRYNRRLSEITDGAVKSVTAMPAMKSWVESQGVEVASLDKGGVIELLEQHQDKPHVCEVLRIRQTAGKSSVAKLDRFEVLTDETRRMLENFLFHAANTGRLGGRGAQLQNLPSRGGLPWYWAEECIRIILETEDPEWAATRIELIYGEIPMVLSSCLRGIIQSPNGTKLFVADYSNIEGRVAAWLGDEKWKLEAFRAYDAGVGPDLYKVTASQILGKLVDLINKVERNVMGKVPELALGFGGGVGAFESMARIYQVDMAEYWEIIRSALDEQFVDKAYWAWGKFGESQATSMGMTQEGWLASETVKNAWRDRHPGIVQSWADCEKLSVKALQNPGKWFPWARGKCAIGAQEIGGKMFLVYRLPSGRRLYRADASLKTVSKFGRQQPEIRFWGVDGVTRQWRRQSTYGGDTFQSCLGAGTLVLTSEGWCPIETVTPEHHIWDGESWVSSDGAVNNGLRQTIDLSGVRITPEHLVLTHEGWKEASSCAGHNRAQSRLPDSEEVRWVGWEEVPLASEVHLRGAEGLSRDRTDQGTEAGDADVLRVPEEPDHLQTGDTARDVAPSSLRGVGLDARQVLPENLAELQGLRGPRDQGLSSVEGQFQQLLGGHGADVSAGPHPGAQECERGLRARELHLGNMGAASAQQAAVDQVASRERPRNITTNRDIAEHAVLPAGARLAIGGAGDCAGPAEPVYDILNCGPRNRFVVRGDNGQPMIVHNCVQAIAYDIMDHGWANAEEAGFDVVLSVHDEIGAEGPEHRELAEFEAAMNDIPGWAEGCPVSSAGYVSTRYRKDE